MGIGAQQEGLHPWNVRWSCMEGTPQPVLRRCQNSAKTTDYMQVIILIHAGPEIPAPTLPEEGMEPVCRDEPKGAPWEPEPEPRPVTACAPPIPLAQLP